MDVGIRDLSMFSFVLEDASVVGLHRVRFERSQNETTESMKELLPPFEGVPLRITIKLSISASILSFLHYHHILFIIYCLFYCIFILYVYNFIRIVVFILFD